MQRLNTLWQIANTAAQIADLARSSQMYRFNVEGSTTFYLHTASAEVSVTRWAEPVIEVEALLQAPFGWRVETDQDDAGVYFVARRRAVVGGIAGATFKVRVPESTYLVLKLDNARLALEGATGTIELPPTAQGQTQLRVVRSEKD